MPNVKDSPEFVEDLDSIGRIAKDASDRHLALTACLSQFWTSPTNIGRLERIDDTGADEWHGWEMRPWKKS